MAKRIRCLTFFLAVVSLTAFGQDSWNRPEWYGKLVPGQSTKIEVDALLGQPLNNISETLLEYKPLYSGDHQLYVQYHKGSHVVDRIEMVFSQPLSRDAAMRNHLVNLSRGSMFAGQDTSAVKATTTLINSKGRLEEYLSSDYVVMTHESKSLTSNVIRLALYSKDLFDGAVSQLRH